MNRQTKTHGILVLLASLLTLPAYAQTEAGACAGVQGAVEIEHAGVWHGASVGSAVAVGDRVRTGAQSRASVVLGDESVIDLAPQSEIALETHEVDTAARHQRVLVHLAAGKVRVWASALSGDARSRYEVESPTAIALVRASEFIVAYDRVAESTEVVGLEGRVDVHAKLAMMGTAVEVAPHFFTRVAKGRFPVQPQRVGGTRLLQYLDGVDLIGTGRRDGLNVVHPVVTGHLLAPQDVPSLEGASTLAPESAPGLVVQGPLPGSVADNLSPDVYTNTQPLRDYQQTPPGNVPPSATGGVHVGF